MTQKIREFVEDSTLKVAQRLLGYSGSSRILLDGVGTYCTRFSDGSLYVIETYGDTAISRATGTAAEWYQLLLRVMNLTEL